MNLPAEFDNAISGIDVSHGKCSFFNDRDCKDGSFIFDKTNDYDHYLQGGSNDAISSFKCRECQGDEECQDDSAGTELTEADDPSSSSYGDMQLSKQEEDLMGLAGPG